MILFVNISDKVKLDLNVASDHPSTSTPSPEHTDIHMENDAAISKMSEDQILEKQQALIGSLGMFEI